MRPSDLIRKIFPNVPADVEMGAFTTFCGDCGGIQVVHRPDLNPENVELAPEPDAPKKKWWQFGK